MKSLTEAELRRLLEEAHRKGYESACTVGIPLSVPVDGIVVGRVREEDIDKIMERV